MNKKYYIVTIGCQMNKSDSERIAGYLEQNGYVKTDKRDRADLVVLTTCGVRQSAEDRIYGSVPKIKKENPKAKIILTGCLSEREDVKKRIGDKIDIWLPTREIPNLKFQITNKSPHFAKASRGRQIPNLKSKIYDYLKLAPKYESKISAFVPIGNGCENYCSYCVVPYARGKEVYRPAHEIISEVEKLVKNGYKEITLIAQNVNSYKSRIATNQKTNSREFRDINFAGLLKMVNDIEGDFWIRFATSHPKDMSDELIKTVAECDKLCKHVHLPVQAGDDEVLKKMNRKYTVKHYKGLIKRIRKLIATNKKTNSHESDWQPPVAITTDIIVGFPGETKKQFDNTLKLCKDIKFDQIYSAQYSPRPGTAAAKLKDDVEKKEKKRREEELMKVLKKTALENNKKYSNKTIEVLIKGINRKGKLWGKTRTDKSVIIEKADPTSPGRRGARSSSPRFAVRGRGKQKADNIIGKFVIVKIIEVKDFGIKGFFIN